MISKKEKTASLSFWYALVDLVELELAFKDIADKFKDGAIKSTDFELLDRGVYSLYSMRLNSEQRLLATTLEVNDKSYLVFLEVSLKHYKDAFFKNAADVTKFMIKNLSGLIALIGRLESEHSTRRKELTALPMPIPYKPATIHDKVISLSDEQLTILQQITGSTLITGAPGTGKTALAFKIMERELLNQPAEEEKDLPIVYLTQSSPLATAMEKKWNELPHTNIFGRQVQFKCIAQVIEEFIEHSEVDKGKVLVGKNHFNEWLDTFLKKNQSKREQALTELHELIPHEGTLKELIYQELRLLSGYNDAQYLNTEQRVPSLFTDLGQRAWFAAAYASYQGRLLDDKAINPVFFSTTLKARYARVIVDEFQDFSLGLIRLIFQQLDSQPVLVGDPKQALEDELAQEPYIISLHQGQSLTRLQLRNTHRCPPQVMRLANIVNLLGCVLNGRALLKDDMPLHPANDEAQSVYWYPQVTALPDKEELLNKLRGSMDVIVITLEEHKEMARKEFAMIPVVTIQEVKGMQFDWVICYRPMDDTRFYRANKENAVQNYDFERALQPLNRAKHIPVNALNHLIWASLFATLTRTCKGFILFQEEHHQVKYLTGFIKRILNMHHAQTQAMDLKDLKQNSKLDWFLKAGEAFDNGNVEYAREIHLNIIGRTLEEFNCWKNKRELDAIKARKNAQRSRVLAPIQGNTTAQCVETKEKKSSVAEVILTTGPLHDNSLKCRVDRAIKRGDVNVLQQLILKEFDQPVSVDGAEQHLFFYIISNEISLHLHVTQFSDAFISQLRKKNISDVLCRNHPDKNEFPRNSFSLLLRSNIDFLVRLFSTTEASKKLVENPNFLRILFEQCGNKEQTGNDHFQTIVYFFTSKPAVFFLLELCKIKSFYNKLINAPQFIPTLLRQFDSSSGKTSLLYCMSQTNNGNLLLTKLCESTAFIGKLIASEELIPAFFSIEIHNNRQTTALSNMLCIANGVAVLGNLLGHPTFRSKLAESPYFVPELLREITEHHFIALRYLIIDPTGLDLFIKLCNEHDGFLDNIIKHKNFIPFLLATDHNNTLAIILSHKLAIDLFLKIINKMGKANSMEKFRTKEFINALCSHQKERKEATGLTYLVNDTKSRNSAGYRTGFDFFIDLFSDDEFFSNSADNVSFVDALFCVGRNGTFPLVTLLKDETLGKPFLLRLFDNDRFSDRVFREEGYRSKLFTSDNRNRHTIISFLLTSKLKSLFFRDLCANLELRSMFMTAEGVDVLLRPTGSGEFPSVFHAALVDEDGTEFLNLAFLEDSFRNNLFMDEQLVTCLCTKAVNSSDPRAPLDLLLEHEHLKMIFANLCDYEPLVQGLCKRDDLLDSLLTPIATAGGYLNRLYSLLSHDGCCALTELSLICPNLIPKLRADPRFIPALLAQHPDNSSALYMLCSYIEGFQMFKKLCDNSHFLSRLCSHNSFEKVLAAAIIEMDGEEANSILLCLKSCNEGIAILEQMKGHRRLTPSSTPYINANPLLHFATVPLTIDNITDKKVPMP